jgi:beta-lactamase family protein
MGSTNKIMVALLVLEQAERGKASLEGEVTVSEDRRQGGSLRGLDPGAGARLRCLRPPGSRRWGRKVRRSLRDLPPGRARVSLVAEESVEGLVDGDPEVGREVGVLEDLPGSAKPGTTLGEIVVSVDGERVRETPLVASKGYDAASLWERV